MDISLQDELPVPRGSIRNGGKVSTLHFDFGTTQASRLAEARLMRKMPA